MPHTIVELALHGHIGFSHLISYNSSQVSWPSAARYIGIECESKTDYKQFLNQQRITSKIDIE